MAIATKGDSKDVYWDGFEVADYDPVVGIIDEKYVNHRTFPTCLLPASKSKRQQFYQHKYHVQEEGGLKNLL